jgi:hypothetical protein
MKPKTYPIDIKTLHDTDDGSIVKVIIILWIFA